MHINILKKRQGRLGLHLHKEEVLAWAYYWPQHGHRQAVAPVGASGISPRSGKLTRALRHAHVLGAGFAAATVQAWVEVSDESIMRAAAHHATSTVELMSATSCRGAQQDAHGYTSVKWVLPAQQRRETPPVCKMKRRTTRGGVLTQSTHCDVTAFSENHDQGYIETTRSHRIVAQDAKVYSIFLATGLTELIVYEGLNLI